MGDVRYTGNWNSVNAHTVPKWYDDCKFGIFIHWGIYSVPAFAPHTWELGEVDSKEWFAYIPQVLHLYSLGEEYDKSGKLHSFLIQRNE
ncbi:alpha-L-fucosidase [Parabacteroides gordonii]|uniref:alpha-L-fucosidase n=1 Tax=Parabacteroides gordonii TaxID=574930 RepID=UPI0026F31856|nr:alpha-L-fucosidase [Parabacteroides gordonii]